MKADDFWLARIRDNRMRGLVSELAEAINGCDDPEMLHLLRGTLKLGLANHAALREEEVRNAMRKRALSAVSRRPRRLVRRSA